MSDNAAAYDAAYYQDGESRGTLYRNYAATALLSRVYHEFAETIVTCFRPTRVLEIGCALGPVVYNLNDMDVEAFGVDPSEWAVENRMHPNVSLASTESLPFPDGSFDFVFSCHALEHLTEQAREGAFSEMSRVCSGLQLHLHPMIGTPPYNGDEFGHRVNLRTDPTHLTLRSRPWWIERWSRTGWLDTNVRIAYAHDNDSFEFSQCQYLLGKQPLEDAVLQRIAEHNFKVARAFQRTLAGASSPGHEHHIQRIRQG